MAAISLTTLIEGKVADDWEIEFRATNGVFAGGCFMFFPPLEFTEFAKRLIGFPAGLSDEPAFDLGGDAAARHFRVTARMTDRTGRAALEIAIGSGGDGVDKAHAAFHISCEVADINRLGHDIRRWINDALEPMLWVDKPELD